MALALALLAGWAGLRGRRVAMWSLCILTLSCKEDQVYTIGVLALLMRAYGAPEVRKHWRFILYLGGAWLLIGTGLVQQYFRDYGYTDIVYYRWLIGLNPDVPVSALAVLEALFRPGAVLMVAGIVASLGALPLLAPRWLLLVIPPYLASVLSEHVPTRAVGEGAPSAEPASDGRSRPAPAIAGSGRAAGKSTVGCPQRRCQGQP